MSAETVVVGIPTYNNEASIGTTLDVVLSGTRQPDRIVVCDASDDDTRAVVRDCASDTDVPIEIIDQPGDGVADAYNAILEYVEGEYDILATLQTELKVVDDWLETHLEIHRENPEIDLVNGDRRGHVDIEGEVGPTDQPYYVGRNFSAKAGALEAIDGWDPNFLRGEDWDMRIRLAGAGIRSYHEPHIGYMWQTDSGSDPYVSLSKARRKPTSISFLDKFGLWYVWFHPSHVVADTLSVSALVFSMLGLVTLPISPVVSLASFAVFVLSVFVYYLSHIALRGGVDDDYLVGPGRKQILNGLAVLYAARRVLGKGVDWNMSGFDPENTPRYKF